MTLSCASTTSPISSCFVSTRPRSFLPRSRVSAEDTARDARDTRDAFEAWEGTRNEDTVLLHKRGVEVSSLPTMSFVLRSILLPKELEDTQPCTVPSALLTFTRPRRPMQRMVTRDPAERSPTIGLQRSSAELTRSWLMTSYSLDNSNSAAGAAAAAAGGADAYSAAGAAAAAGAAGGANAYSAAAFRAAGTAAAGAAGAYPAVGAGFAVIGAYPAVAAFAEVWQRRFGRGGGGGGGCDVSLSSCLLDRSTSLRDEQSTQAALGFPQLPSSGTA